MRFSFVPFTCSLLAFSLLAARISQTPGAPFVFHHENVLGTSLELKIVATSQTQADIAEIAVLHEIDRMAKILSSYDSASEFSRWFQTSGQPVKVSQELFEVLNLFDQWRARTNSALDASAEAVNRMWKLAASQRRLPANSELAAAVNAVRQKHWSLDAASHTATHLSATPLAMNSFTKSYIIDHAVESAMHVPGVTAAVLNIGGDLVVRGDWSETVQIANPRSDAENSVPIASLQIQNRAVATSGSYRRGVEIGGKHYSHIVDPRTGKPADEILSSTVVAAIPVDAGALATGFSLMPVTESQRLAATMPSVDYLLVKKDGTQIVSKGWKNLQVAMNMMPPADNPPAVWNSGFELLINIELSRIDGYYRRPYTAIWIEDKDKFPVRTVSLWYQKPRWLPDLKAWNRSDRLRATTEGNEVTGSISSATRPPGKYTLKWDGKDNAGKLVKAGKYTVCIEAAREHGTYQLIRQEMEFNETPKLIQLPGNTEIASASLDYRKAAH